MAELRMNFSTSFDGGERIPAAESEVAYAMRLQALVAGSKADPRPSVDHATAMRLVEERLAAIVGKNGTPARR